MNKYLQIQQAFIISCENQASIEWDFLTPSEKSIYNDKREFTEVKTREAIHYMAVVYGLMK